ncbi:Uncharacterised protein [Bordetella pertussis]|nr:Uncharacterised protein [Bordetella pertussis]
MEGIASGRQVGHRRHVLVGDMQHARRADLLGEDRAGDVAGRADAIRAVAALLLVLAQVVDEGLRGLDAQAGVDH